MQRTAAAHRLLYAAYATRCPRIEYENAAAPSRVSGECGGISVCVAVAELVLSVFKRVLIRGYALV